MTLLVAAIFQNPRYRGNGGEKLSIPVLTSIGPLALWTIPCNDIQHLKASCNYTMTDNRLYLARKQGP